MQRPSKNQRQCHNAVYANKSKARAEGPAVSEEQRSILKNQIEQRIILLLVLINENSRTSSSDASRNMFQVQSGEPEGLVIAKSQREITALTRGLVWLESEFAGYCKACGCVIEELSVETVIGSRCCSSCERNDSGELNGGI
jgi:RNA polymerase-binding transcription factor DksA